MSRAALTGMLLLLPFGLVCACGGDSGPDVPSGYKRVESGGLRFIVPESFRVDENPDSGELFIANPPGMLAQQPRVVGSAGSSQVPFEVDVANLRDVNTAGLGDFEPVSDDKVDVPGSDEAHRIVTTFSAGLQRDIPTRSVLMVARKGTTVYQLLIAVPDAKRDAIDAAAVARSLAIV